MKYRLTNVRTKAVYLSVGVGALAAFILVGCSGGGDGDGGSNGAAGTIATGGAGAGSTDKGGAPSAGAAGEVTSSGGAAGEANASGAGGTAGSNEGGAGAGGTSTAGTSAGGSAGAGGSETPWAPTQLSGLVLWLDAGKGVKTADKTKVESWADISRFPDAGHDAKAVGATYRPSYPQFVKAGEKPTVDFSGAVKTTPTYLEIANHDDFQWGYRDFTVLVVARFSGDTEPQTLFAKYEFDANYRGPSLFVGKSSVISQLGKGNVNTVAGDNQGKLHVFGMRRKFDTTSKLPTLNSQLGTGIDGKWAYIPVSGSPSASIADPIVIGSRRVAAHPEVKEDTMALTGSIAEILAVKDDIGDDNLAKLEAYLFNKYKITPAK